MTPMKESVVNSSVSVYGAYRLKITDLSIMLVAVAANTVTPGFVIWGGSSGYPHTQAGTRSAALPVNTLLG